MKVISLFIGLLVFVIMSLPVQVQAVVPTTTPTPIHYQLPYPGILPGHPFYFLKALRDNLSGFFISNPLKKAEFDLLQADKSIATSQYLFNQKKDTTVVIAAIIKAENYFSDALSKAADAKKQGMDSKDLLKRLHLANLKHQEIVLAMTKTATKKDSSKLAAELKKIKEFEKKTK